MKRSIAFKTYAKINISLDVTGVRDNGYHEVSMVMHGVNLYDRMSVKLLPAKEHKISIKTDKYYVPCDERNTAWKAAKLVIDEFSPDSCEIRIDIKKIIPVSAGLAGGSSNAAGVLLALNHLFELGLDIEGLCRLGVRIGADVPFCIKTMAAAEHTFGMEGGTVCALAEGIGELLSPLPHVSFWTVLVKPPAGMSTKEVYTALDALPGYEHPDTPQVIRAMTENDLIAMKASMKNVLENVTLKKLQEAASIKEKLSEIAGDEFPVMMSGSGPTIFALFDKKEMAEAAAAQIKNSVNNRKTEVFCVETL